MARVRWFTEVGRDDVAAVGGKGAGLGELTRAGLPVPPGFVIDTDAYRAFVAAAGIRPGEAESFTAHDVPADLAAEILVAYADLGGGPVAVRSSATTEDLAETSAAGQQDTFLNVRGPDALLQAVRECWASLWTARAVAYRAGRGVDESGIALAVVVQEMVESEASGVLFTANPTTGRRDQAVVSAAWGLGESVVGGLVNTEDLVVDKPTGQVLSRVTGHQDELTVYADERTVQRPLPAALRERPVLDDPAAAALVSLGVRVERLFGVPQDIEWARAGGRFYLVQARPVTALPEEEAEPPTEWPLPVPKDLYFRASIVEQLPGPLSPLFADLIDGSVERSLRALLSEMLAPSLLREGDIGLPTINGYAYYRYSRRAFTRMSASTPMVLTALVARGPGWLRERWRDVAHPLYAGTVAVWAGRPLDGIDDAELFGGVTALLDAGTQYYTAVQTIIPLAGASETLFTGFYDSAVRRAGDPPASTFLLGYDSLPIRAEKSLHDLAEWTRAREALAAAVREGRIPAEEDGDAEWRQWWQRFRAHLDEFGHMVYDLDFLHPTPADDPEPLLEALRLAIDGAVADPHVRQRRSAERREELTAAVSARLDPARRAVFRRLLRWAQDVAPEREDALADVGLAWPQMRRMLAELGRRRVADGTITVADDVYWLHPAEVLGEVPVPGAAVAARKALWRGRRRVTPPQMLPKGPALAWLEGFLPAVSEQAAGNVLRGTGAGGGAVTATARVLDGPSGPGRLQPGEVLVAAITTPAWTPLFARAGAVVTDVGGPLSHSSIVAREYGIPAVLGTGVATKRIGDGARIRVDGDAGTVTLLDEPAAVQAPSAGRGITAPVVVGLAAVAAAVWWRSRRR